jgi:hypothetical protein
MPIYNCGGLVNFLTILLLHISVININTDYSMYTYYTSQLYVCITVEPLRIVVFRL